MDPPLPTPSPATTPAPAPTPKPARRPRRRRVAAATAGVLVLAGAGTAIALAATHQVVREDHLVGVDITTLDVEAGPGDVEIRGGAAPGTVEVTRRSRSSDLPALGPGSMRGTTLSLAPDCPGGCSVDFDIRVPDSVRVTVHSDSGEIKLDGTLGAVSLQTGSGDVDADITTDDAAIRTDSGDMDLRLRSAPTRLSATSDSGDVDIRLPRGSTYSVDPQTGSGDVDVDLPSQAGADHVVQVGTESGDISVRAR